MRSAALVALLCLGFDAWSSQAPSLHGCHELSDTGAAEAPGCYEQFLQDSVDLGERAEAYWRLGRLNAANVAYREALALDAANARLLARWGRLYLAAHQYRDAEELFQEALAINAEELDALLGLAELFADRFEARAEEVLQAILSIEPAQPDAMVLLARLHLEVGETADARALLKETLEGAPPVRAELAAYALLAAADHVENKLPSAWIAKALAINPSFGDVYAVPAYFYIITRRYTEAVALLERAVAVQPTHWAARTDLGINLLRLNRFEEARENLGAAYAGDPFNAEVVNTLRLLDSMEHFDELHFDHLILRAHKTESAVLSPYVRELVDRMVETMAGRYGYVLERPAVIELYQHHDDFAVRTAGLPGLGILGATFGDVVVMDGPSAKTADEFDWYSALWHELAHIVTLNATQNKVSRWFAEGVSVYEEWRYGPSAGLSLPIHFLEAMNDDRLLPVADLDEGFIRPKYDNQIGVSYLQAGLVCDFIAREYEHGLRDVLRAYADGASSAGAIEQGLGVSVADFDARFKADLQKRLGPVAALLDTFKDLGTGARKAAEEERWADVVALTDEAIGIYPAYIGEGSPYLLKASAQREAGAHGGELETLLQYWRRGGRSVGAMSALAGVLFEHGRVEDAIAVERTLVRTAPLIAAHHARLGEHLVDAQAHVEALREFNAVIALGPHDEAVARYNVATALYALDDVDAARQELLRALEIAPRLRPALALLLKIQ